MWSPKWGSARWWFRIWKLHKNCDVWVEHVEDIGVQGASSSISLHSSAIPRCGSPNIHTKPTRPPFIGGGLVDLFMWAEENLSTESWQSTCSSEKDYLLTSWAMDAACNAYVLQPLKTLTYVGQLTALTYCHQHISKLYKICNMYIYIYVCVCVYSYIYIYVFEFMYIYIGFVCKVL